MFVKKRKPLLRVQRSDYRSQRKSSAHSRGFTLIELLTVILIIAILSVASLIIYTNVTKRTHDSVRVGDLTNINVVITTLLQESSPINASLMCVGSGTFPCRGSIDGTGWIKMNFVGQNNISFSQNSLPVDPTNDATYHYTYCANNGQWEVNATLEVNDQNKMQNDGGDDNNKYEIGTNMNLINVVGGCNY
jgi:prepilin-type N-terminal cleavage/methylation domain-containing protein